MTNKKDTLIKIVYNAIIGLILTGLLSSCGKASLNGDSNVAEKNGFSVTLQKPLVTTDKYLIFRFWTKSKKYWIRNTPDGHLKWGICGLGKCEGYHSGFLKTIENKGLNENGYHSLTYSHSEEYRPGQEKGITVGIDIKSNVLKGDNLKVATNFSGDGLSYLPFIFLMDEFGKFVASYDISAMFAKKGGEWVPVSVELLETGKGSIE